MIVTVDPKDVRAVGNKDNVLALYEMMIDQKKSEEGTARFLSPKYVQHNPLIPDGSEALGHFFGKITGNALTLESSSIASSQLATTSGRTSIF